jgi:DNA-binding NarL/FixJ family response regulator
MPVGPIMILIADPHALIRYALRALVVDLLGDVVILEANDIYSLGNSLNVTKHATLALIDLKIFGMENSPKVSEFANRYPQVSMVILSTLESYDLVHRILSIPTVLAILPKISSIEEMRLVIASALKGQKLPLITLEYGRKIRNPKLTPRQEQIWNLLRTGMSNKLIAAKLFISEGTVKNHLTGIYKALKTTNRTQAAGLNFEEWQ